MNEPALSEAHLDILWHSLGMKSSNYRRSMTWWSNNENHRNFFCVAAGNREDVSLLEEMVLRRWMVRGQIINNGEMQYYYVTEDGIKVAKENFPRPAKTSRAKKEAR